MKYIIPIRIYNFLPSIKEFINSKLKKFRRFGIEKVGECQLDLTSVTKRFPSKEVTHAVE